MDSAYVRRLAKTCAVALCAAAAACEASDPTGLGTAGVTLEGRVVSLQSSSGAAAGAAQAGGISFDGIEVSVDGSTAVTLTESDGSFHLEFETRDDRIVVRFRRGSIDLSLTLEGVSPGTTVRLEVGLGDEVSVLHRDDRHGDDDEDDDDDDLDRGDSEFEGQATLESLVGNAPERVLQVALSRDGRTVTIEIDEGSTMFEAAGDISTFEGLLAALDGSDLSVKIEGDGEVQTDGTVLARSIKVETDEDADDDGGVMHAEFKGRATLVSVTGAAPTRVVRVAVDSEDDEEGTVVVDLVEGETGFDHSGDLLTVGSVLAALEQSDLDRFEGKGLMGQDGVIVATIVRAEVR